MSIKNDKWITYMCDYHNMISPYVPNKISQMFDQRVISYGMESFGYGIIVADEYQIFSPATGEVTVIDPKNFDERCMVKYTGDVCVIPPNSFALARSVEYIRMPSNVTGIVLGKSTYARCGIVTNFTPLEAGWHGHITIEISNTTPLPAKIYSNEGIAQVLFFEGEEPNNTYGEGKYQGQTGITPAKV